MVWQLMNSDRVSQFRGFAAVGKALDPEKADHYRRQLTATGDDPAPVPVMYVHGTGDHTFRPPATLAEVPIDTTHPASRCARCSAATTSHRNAAAATTLVPGSTDLTEVVVQDYSGNAAFSCATVINGGHNWPGPTHAWQPASGLPLRHHRSDPRLLARQRRAAVSRFVDDPELTLPAFEPRFAVHRLIKDRGGIYDTRFKDGRLSPLPAGSKLDSLHGTLLALDPLLVALVIAGYDPRELVIATSKYGDEASQSLGYFWTSLRSGLGLAMPGNWSEVKHIVDPGTWHSIVAVARAGLENRH